jgi:uncharacterized protein
MWPPEAIASLKETWLPGQEAIDREISALTGGLKEQLIWRIPETFKMETFVFFIWMGWRALSMMMIGMGLLKLGVLSASLSKKFYVMMAGSGLSLGFLLILNGIQKNFEANWSVEYSMFFGWQWNYIGSLFMALGYIAIVMLLCKLINMNLLAKVGKLAFTNYILMTLICTTLFYGHGFSMFGTMPRTQQMVTVGIIWMVILAFSHFWSSKFYYGPLEWLWRFLTYGNKADFKK